MIGKDFLSLVDQERMAAIRDELSQSSAGMGTRNPHDYTGSITLSVAEQLAISELISSYLNTKPDTEPYAEPDTEPKRWPRISYTMRRHLLGETRYNVTSSSVKALQKHGLLDNNGRRTSDGLEMVRSIMLGRNNVFPKGSKIINTFEELDRLWSATCDPSIYVYRGNEPMLVSDGDGQNPVGYVCNWLIWRMFNDDSVKGQYEKETIIGHKGSYSVLKNA